VTTLASTVPSLNLPPIPQPRIPVGWVSMPCWYCQGATLVREDTPEAPECSSCRRMHLEAAAAQACGDVRDLIHGTGIFAPLSYEERKEQLAAFDIHIDPHRTDVDAPDAVTRDELESRIELDEPQPVFEDDYAGGTY